MQLAASTVRADGERYCRLCRGCPPRSSRPWARRRLLVAGIWEETCVIANQQRRGSRPLAGVTALAGPGSAPKKWLTVTALPRSEQGVLVLRVVGEVDLATVGRLRECLHKYVLGAHQGAVVLDCTGVSFLASCGVGLLVEIADQARAEGVVLRLVTQSRVVLRALKVTGVDGLVPRAATVAEAVLQCST